MHHLQQGTSTLINVAQASLSMGVDIALAPNPARGGNISDFLINLIVLNSSPEDKTTSKVMPKAPAPGDHGINTTDSKKHRLLRRSNKSEIKADAKRPKITGDLRRPLLVDNSCDLSSRPIFRNNTGPCAVQHEHLTPGFVHLEQNAIDDQDAFISSHKIKSCSEDGPFQSKMGAGTIEPKLIADQRHVEKSKKNAPMRPPSVKEVASISHDQGKHDICQVNKLIDKAPSTATANHEDSPLVKGSASECRIMPQDRAVVLATIPTILAPMAPIRHKTSPLVTSQTSQMPRPTIYEDRLVVQQKVLKTTPSLVELEIVTGSHGRLRLHAELAGDGKVNAALSSDSRSGEQILHDGLSSLTAFLKNDNVRLELSHIYDKSPGRNEVATDVAGNNSSNHEHNKKEPNQYEMNDVESFQNQGEVEGDVLSREAIGWALPLQHATGGNWLSIIV